MECFWCRQERERCWVQEMNCSERPPGGMTAEPLLPGLQMMPIQQLCAGKAQCRSRRKQQADLKGEEMLTLWHRSNRRETRERTELVDLLLPRAPQKVRFWASPRSDWAGSTCRVKLPWVLMHSKQCSGWAGCEQGQHTCPVPMQHGLGWELLLELLLERG